MNEKHSCDVYMNEKPEKCLGIKRYMKGLLKRELKNRLK